MVRKATSRTLWKSSVFAVMAMPAALLLWQWALVAQGQPSEMLGANPVQATVLKTGEFAMRALLISLTISPLASLFGKPQLIAYRRMLGLFAFFYASLHGLSHIGLDHFFSAKTLLEDLLKRWPITLGFAAWAALVPLAVTSTSKMIRRIGAKRWKKLHQLVYALAVVAIVHNVLITKGWQVEPLVHAAVLAALLIYRMAGRPRLVKLPRPAKVQQA
ncbi:MAG: protein-methionine-sulfoxide reductase heme-binding subunit MsrQ [Pseudomonadota bacterium]